MSKPQDRTVFKNAKGRWVNKRNEADKASTMHAIQRTAWLAARSMLQRQGGGELTVMDVDGKIKSKDTIAPGNDPMPLIDTEY